MKEHITPKQAKELTEEQFYSLFDSVVSRKDWAKYHHKKVTIGKMIDFLSPIYMHQSPISETWEVRLIGDKHRSRIGLTSEVFYASNLADALWEAVKQIVRCEGRVI